MEVAFHFVAESRFTDGYFQVFVVVIPILQFFYVLNWGHDVFHDVLLALFEVFGFLLRGLILFFGLDGHDEEVKVFGFHFEEVSVAVFHVFVEDLFKLVV